MATYFVSGTIAWQQSEDFGSYEFDDVVDVDFEVNSKHTLNRLRRVVSESQRTENGYDTIMDLVFTNISRLDFQPYISYMHIHDALPVDAVSRTLISI